MVPHAEDWWIWNGRRRLELSSPEGFATLARARILRKPITVGPHCITVTVGPHPDELAAFLAEVGPMVAAYGFLYREYLPLFQSAPRSLINAVTNARVAVVASMNSYARSLSVAADSRQEAMDKITRAYAALVVHRRREERKQQKLALAGGMASA